MVDGDTLYVRGSSVTYISFTLRKNIKIVGLGYFLADNSKTHNSKNSARISTIAFANADFSSASGSSISGMEIITQLKLYEVSNILIEKNKVKQIYFQPGATGIHNILIMQNYLGPQTSTSTSGYELFYSSAASFDGVIVANNIIKTPGTYSPMSGYFRQGSVNFYNNYFEGGYIVMPGLAVVYDNLFYNIYGSSDLGSSASNNLIVSSLSGVLDTDEQADHYNVLSDGSPAIGYGVTGGDFGISGGDRPYVLSGMPGIPSIYSITSPGTAEIVKIEYYIDTDPGYNQGTDVSFTQGDDVTVSFDIPMTGLVEGFHYLYLRARDEKGSWSLSEIFKLSDYQCESSEITLGNTTYINNATLQSQTSISSSMIAPDTFSVTYRAPVITLKPDFHAQPGSQFKATATSVKLHF